MPYKFEENELLKLLIRAYDEGNCGFLDLAESVAEKIIGDNKDHEVIPTSFTYNPTPPYNADIFPGAITINNGWTGEVSITNIQVDNLADLNSNQVGPM